MKELIEAFTIFAKYTDARCTGCEHDTLYVYVNPAEVSAADIARLDELGFHACAEDENFYSYRYGSA
jgi:hypothetical protein